MIIPRYPTLPVKHDAFDRIDSFEKAYLLGFLAADGCVIEPRSAHSSWRVDLKILTQDIEVCLMLQAETGGSLFHIEGGYRISCQISSTRIAQALVALGITPRKTFTLALRWDLIPERLHGTVLAGLVDGDGSIRINRAARRACINLVTASATLKDQLLMRFPFFKVKEEPPSTRRKSLLFRLEVESNREKLKAMLSTVYDPLPFPILTRKQRILDQIRAYVDDQDAYERRLAEVPALKAEGFTITQIAEKLGTSRRPVQEKLKRDGIDSRIEVFTPEDIEEMKRLHAQGLAPRKIHAVMGKATEQAVRYHLQCQGCLPRKERPVMRHPRTDEILRLHREGLPAYQIAEKTRLGHLLVCKILRREGITLTKGSPLKLTPERLLYAEQELRKGRTLTSVADELGVSATLIRMRRKEKGWNGCNSPNSILARTKFDPEEH